MPNITLCTIRPIKWQTVVVDSDKTMYGFTLLLILKIKELPDGKWGIWYIKTSPHSPTLNIDLINSEWVFKTSVCSETRAQHIGRGFYLKQVERLLITQPKRKIQ